MNAVSVLDDQLSPVVLAGLAEEQRRREIGPDALARAAHVADGVVDVAAERVAALVAIEQRRKDAERQRGGREEWIGFERTEDQVAPFAATGWCSGSCRLSFTRPD